MAALRFLVLAVPCAALITACDKSPKEAIDALPKTEITQQSCAARLPGTGAKQIVQNPEKPTSCWAVVMMCNTCEYDDGGQFTGEGKEACGVCFGFETE